MKPGARRRGDLPDQEPSALFDAAVGWAREHYGITKAPVTDWGRWRGEPMESIMRIVWHGSRRVGELHPTKKGLAARFGLSPSCTAALNCSLPLFEDEEDALTQIVAGLGSGPLTTCVLVGVGNHSKIHLPGRFPGPGNYGNPPESMTACGRRGRVVEIDLSEDLRDLCSMCAWRASP